MANAQQLTVSVGFERRIKELTNIIAQCEMMVEMAKSEITTLQANAQTALQQAEKDQPKDVPATNG